MIIVIFNDLFTMTVKGKKKQTLSSSPLAPNFAGNSMCSSFKVPTNKEFTTKKL